MEEVADVVAQYPVVAVMMIGALWTALLGVIAYHVRRVDQGIDTKFSRLFKMVEDQGKEVRELRGAHDLAQTLHGCPMDVLKQKLDGCPLLGVREMIEAERSNGG